MGDVAQILALTGSDRETIQALLGHAARDFRAAGYHVVGVVEEMLPGGTDVLLRDLVSGAQYKLTQDLGPGSAGCSLDPAGLAAACAGVEEAISALDGASAGKGTVVILSKFGRQEAEGRGLTHAFHAAVAAELPILTSVSPVVVAAWEGFAGELSSFAPVEPEAVTGWRERLGGADAVLETEQIPLERRAG
ncbi:hypothetical protein GCM10007301_11510 [Azorhizobium oxalatiphilum]|uniref:DUF2478 domain-containing protein n=2 Tax=Azorhizobium oxalatiphilum TaxID=980631 RepID=A0A917F719_9HYPH|nr:hypothetical protein GCM10007301_11510 [Azorhizobium oxalatiphilum]